MNLCNCGCGQPAPIAKRDYPERGVRRGEPLRFVNGHSGRAPDVKAKLSAAKKGRPLAASARAKLNSFWDEHRTPVYDRWLAKVEKTDDCWIWNGAAKETGYGVLNDGTGRTIRAHRFAYEYFVGPIPNGLDVRHSCHNRRCVNPEHLSVGTRRDNMRDMVEAGRYGPSRVRRGVANPHGKLTDDDVRAIRRDPRPLAVIAAEHGVSRSYVSAIRHRHQRADVPDAMPGR